MDRYELLQMEMVATNLASIVVIVTDSNNIQSSSSVGFTYIFAFNEIIFFQGFLIICTVSFLLANDKK